MEEKQGRWVLRVSVPMLEICYVDNVDAWMYFSKVSFDPRVANLAQREAAKVGDDISCRVMPIDQVHS